MLTYDWSVSQKPKLVFVFLGSKKIPKYARLNLTLIRKTFPDIEMVLISDNIRNGNLVKGISVYLVPRLNQLWPEIHQTISHDLAFRNGFWFSSIARFMAIKQWMSKGNEGPIIHLELDVLMSPGFPISLFENITEDLAYTLASPSEGSAAVLFIKDFAAISKLVLVAEDIFSKQPGATDMTILRNIYDDQIMPIKILPSIPVGSTDPNDLFSEYIFDPSSWGMYLLGQDPRNHRGSLILNRSELHHFVQPREFVIQYKSSELFVENLLCSKQLVSLHVHSKDLRVFKSPRRTIKHRIRLISGGEYSEMIPSLFIRLSWKKAIKEVTKFLCSKKSHK